MDNEEASSLSPHHRGTVGRVAARPGAHYHYYLGFVAFEGPAPLSLGLLFFFFLVYFFFHSQPGCFEEDNLPLQSPKLSNMVEIMVVISVQHSPLCNLLL